MSSLSSISHRFFALFSAVVALFFGLLRVAQGRLAGKTADVRMLIDGVSLNAGGKGDGPPDLEELWRDMNKKLNGLFGGKGGNSPRRDNNGSNGGDKGGSGLEEM